MAQERQKSKRKEAFTSLFKKKKSEEEKDEAEFEGSKNVYLKVA